MLLPEDLPGLCSVTHSMHTERPGEGVCIQCGKKFSSGYGRPFVRKQVDPDFEVRVDPVTLEPLDPMDRE